MSLIEALGFVALFSAVAFLVFVILFGAFLEIREWMLRRREDKKWNATMKRIEDETPAYNERRRQYLIEKYLHPYKDE